ncbi:WW domain-binding protein 11-like [Osmia bicornis bicornis]|uniref:WW domain-binding protein 11-like n=1 Tax=Osmia bicornis bicornis TaxID=1437191 RepID=UPI001EAF1D60|nr:WW domain-binding protein 11-like [Osmia bicornis bicornis]
MYGIKQTTIPPYHAQANPVERVNRTLKTMITTFVGEDHRNWDKHLPEFCFAYNTAVHSSSLVSPAFLNFGRNPRPIQNLRHGIKSDSLIIPRNPQEWSNRISRLTLLYDIVHRNLEKASYRQASYYNRGRRDERYQIGDLVMRRQRILSSAAHNFASKLAPKFSGPYTISKILSPVVYELKDSDGNIIPKVHIKDLKPFRPPPNFDDSISENPSLSQDITNISQPGPSSQTHDISTQQIPQQTPTQTFPSSPIPTPPPRRGRGRPRKIKAPQNTPPIINTPPTPVPLPRRGRGRPRKTPIPPHNTQIIIPTPIPTPPPRRGRGRPRKVQILPNPTQSIPSQQAPTPPPRRGRGRPRKHPLNPTINVIKTDQSSIPPLMSLPIPRPRIFLNIDNNETKI